MKLQYITAVSVFAILLIAGCDSDSDAAVEPTGTVTATIGGQAFSATTISRIGSSRITYRMSSSDGRRLDFTVVDIDAPGQFSFFNLALTSGPGIAGGYYPGNETYNVDSGTVVVDVTTSHRFAGSFVGTARGLLGATDLPILGGTFDIQF